MAACQILILMFFFTRESLFARVHVATVKMSNFAHLRHALANKDCHNIIARINYRALRALIQCGNTLPIVICHTRK